MLRLGTLALGLILIQSDFAVAQISSPPTKTEQVEYVGPAEKLSPEEEELLHDIVAALESNAELLSPEMNVDQAFEALGVNKHKYSAYMWEGLAGAYARRHVTFGIPGMTVLVTHEPDDSGALTELEVVFQQLNHCPETLFHYELPAEPADENGATESPEAEAP